MQLQTSLDEIVNCTNMPDFWFANVPSASSHANCQIIHIVIN